jgi:hypothetical protein
MLILNIRLKRVDKDLQVLLDGEIEKELAEILGEYEDHKLNNSMRFIREKQAKIHKGRLPINK